MSETYPGQRKVTIILSPTRVAYLVRANSPEDFRRAVAEATSRWAGQSEPILAVSPTGRVRSGDQQIAATLQLDAAVNIGIEDQAVANRAAASLGLPLVPIDRVDHVGSASRTIHALAITHDDKRTQLVLPSCRDLWEVAAAGEMSGDSEAAWLREGVSVRRARTPDEVARAQLLGHTPIGFGMREFLEFAPSGSIPGPVTICVVKPNDLRDIRTFWNLRALATPPFSSPLFVLPWKTDGWLEIADRVMEAVRQRIRSTPSVVLASLSLSEDQLGTIATRFGLVRESSTRLTWDIIGGSVPSVTEPLTYWINTDPRNWLLHDRQYGLPCSTLAHLWEGRLTTLDFASPIKFLGGGRVRARLSGVAALRLPRRPGVAQLFMHAATWRHGNLEFLTHPSDRYQFDVHLPTDDEVLKAAVSQPFELSDKGKYGAALLALVDPGEFLARGMNESVREMTTPRSKELFRELQRSRSNLSDRELIQLAGAWGGRMQRRARSARQVGDRVGVTAGIAAALLERLSALGLATRGLEIRCSHCGLTSFQAFSDVHDNVLCPGCRGEAAHVLESGTVKVNYRLNSLLDTASDNGVVGHLLAIAALKSIDPTTYILPGVNVVVRGKPAELDLLGFMDGKIVAGEVKLAAKEFKNVERDIELSVAIGADVHIMACTDEMPEGLTDQALRIAKRANIELQTLDQRNLRPNTK